MSPTKKLLIGTGVLAAAVVGLALAFGGGEDGLEVELADARVRPITQAVTASGTVAAEVDVAVASDVSGEVVFLAVREGDRVRTGQLLARIRPDVYASQQEQAQAGVATAQAQVGQAARDVEQATVEAAQATVERERAARVLARQQDLFDRDVVAAQELEAARGAFEAAQAAERAARARIETARGRIAGAQSQVRGAQAQARQAGQQLAQTALYAPISGTVSQLNVELGERVVGTQTMAGTDLMRIARLDAMTLSVDVNETEVVRITVGDSARVEVDAFPDAPLVGVVTEIANSARTTQTGATTTTAFPVTIRLAAPGDGPAETLAASADEGAPPRAPGVLLRPGMSGTADVFTQTVAEAVVVPIQAVTVRDLNALAREARLEDDPDADVSDLPDDEDLRRVVFVIDAEGRAEMREVQTGVSDATHIEIRRGLSGTERVVVGPFDLLRTTLRDGDRLREAERTGRAARDDE